MNNKKCRKCLEIKNICCFSKDSYSKDGIRGSCKKCCSKMFKLYTKNNLDKYKEIKKEADKKYRSKNSEKLKIYYKEYRKININEVREKDRKRSKTKKIKETRKQYIDNNREEIKKRNRNYYMENKEAILLKRNDTIQKRLKKKISIGIYRKLKNRNFSKNGKTWDILEYSPEDLKQHLESKFEEGMTWENYGNGSGKWNIDHDIPDSWFDYMSVEDEGFKKSWALENLQPMWSLENSSKRNRYSGKLPQRQAGT